MDLFVIVSFMLTLLGLVLTHILRSREPFAMFSIYVRLFLGVIFFCSGFSKIAHQAGLELGNLIGPVQLENLLAPHGLALLGRFIACAQVVIGLCLFSSRLATLGAIMLVPMLLSIWVVTISMEFRMTPYIVFGFIILNVLLLIHDWPKLKFILWDKAEGLPSVRPALPLHKREYAWWVGAFMALFSIVLFHAWPSYAKPLLKLGVLFMILSSLLPLLLSRWKRAHAD